MANNGKREKIVILGGGVASIATAFQLTRDPKWKEKFESVTVYQMGWRLGGKGASGRGEYGRIEEHGLHLWLGFYENAFRMIRECYAELGRPPGSPLATWDQAFKKASFVGAADRFQNDWSVWPIDFPEDSRNPGDPDTHDPSWDMWYYIERAFELMKSVLESLLGGTLQTALFAVQEFKETMSLDSARHTPGQHAGLLNLLDDFVTRIRRELQERSKTDVEAWRLWCLIELCAANIRGIIDDGLIKESLDKINQYDYREWLKKHRCDEQVADESAVLYGLYDLAFAYRDGDRTKPMFAAGEALRSGSRIAFTYKGAIFWKMQAGMGDVVFAPLYLVLQKRGVQFRFFHRVKNLRLSEDRQSIAAIEMARQVTLNDETAEYRPLISVCDLPCWPAEPLYEQLREGASLRDNSQESEKATGYNLYNLESFWTKWQDVGEHTLRAGEDFDRVVLGISHGSLRYLTQELVSDANNPKWKRMVERVTTVQTQSFQVWLSEDMERLGWKKQIDLSGYVEPFDTWADMRQLIDREAWPADQKPQAIAYFCNTMPTPLSLPPATDPAFPVTQADLVKDNALRFLHREVQVLWPTAVRDGDFQWNLLVGGGEAAGDTRFASQFWRANCDPSERYVQSLPGSNQYRIKTADTGYNNLYIVGDWIDCGLNVGCVEAAVMAAMEASNAISGSPQLTEIIGYKHP